MAKVESVVADSGPLSPLASVSATRAVLDAHGLSAKYSFGQNFLINDAIVRKTLALAELSAEDDVLEVGPGIGTLTVALLKGAARVEAVELDPDLPAVLAETCAPWAARFTLIRKDALKLSGSDLAFPPRKLISNLPYSVAATVVLDFFQRFPSIESATVMVQKEVADRMTALPATKNYGAYTVKLGLFASCAGRFAVSPGNFFPAPRVESAVIRLDRRLIRDDAGNPASRALIDAACLMADAAFCNRRKTIANSCKAYFLGRGAVDLPTLFGAAGINPARRGETLTQQEFLALGKALLSLTAPDQLR